MNNSRDEVNLPEIALLAITRATLGVGAVNTVPIAVEVLGGRNPRRAFGAKRSNARGA